MSFITFIDGRAVDMKLPALTALTPFNIAWSLAQINRFNGHCLRPYSVAEHSMLVCEIAERELGLDVHGQLAALMHDAHESVCGDLHTPGKQAVGDAWRHFEYVWEHTFHTVFALRTAAHAFARQIRQADLMALATERRDLKPNDREPWPALAGIEPVVWAHLNTPDRRRASWEDWRDRFLDRYHALETARTDALYPNPPGPKPGAHQRSHDEEQA